ncbi:hypothetical protein [Pararhodonellum marinum]|uniref:hypothetical protein n=1 Tax=Pararhodonellum marinum TaxID=2755358 RepID=UPI00188ED6B4|nr:hypothetical protein [Pararhodonellum marinum]
MRKLFLILSTLIFLTSGLNAQGWFEGERLYKPFKVDLGINMTFPTDPNLTLGGGMFVAPKYGINDNLHVGIHLGSNILGEGDFIFQNTKATVQAQAISNLSLTTEYYFTFEKVRPLVGLSGGMYRRSDLEIIDEVNGTVISKTGSRIGYGLAPKIGINTGIFRMDLTYHYTGKSITNFVSIGLGIQFGGGRLTPGNPQASQF